MPAAAQRGAFSIAVLGVAVANLTGCSGRAWPPPARDKLEQAMIDSALRAIQQFDGWPETACVVEREGPIWRVQAWKVVYPKATGRDRCVPWATRRITLDSSAMVIGYEN